MSEKHSNPLHRREFIQSGVAATATVAGAACLAGSSPAGPIQAAGKGPLPRRALGKTGVEVTILNQGTVRAPSALDRLLRASYEQGIRYFDTAAGYGTEGAFKMWFAAMPEVRKEIFLATKNGVGGDPMSMLGMIDDRLQALGTDYIDLLFFHGLNGNQANWPRSREMARAVDAIKKTGKVRFVGFSTHDATRAQQLSAAAQGGFIDVVMLQFTPWLEKDSEINRALDACHAKNIGLVSMKQFAGHSLNQVFDRAPVLKQKGLTPHQGLLHAIWTDDRIASACVTMMNFEEVSQDVEAARRFEPLHQAQILELRDAVLAGGPMMCADCDGRCGRAAGTKARLGDLTRFLVYHERFGSRRMAREGFEELAPEERDWHGADLDAARSACPNRLDFAKLLPEVDRLLA